jgi:hypothetical protein
MLETTAAGDVQVVAVLRQLTEWGGQSTSRAGLVQRHSLAVA